MPARPGNWSLLGEANDPIIADVPALEELVQYYRTIADEISSEAVTLKSIGDGDDSEFKGETADAVRAKSKEVAASLQKMSGRYEAVGDALTAYVPQLENALSESDAALRDAEAASMAASRAAAMTDPSQGRAPDAPPLTPLEQGQVDAKHRSANVAHDEAGAAQARLRRAVDALNVAGAAAAGMIREAWHDGLHDSRADRIKAAFAKFLKWLVKIFTFIGIALAFFAIVIPGLGIAAILGAVSAGVSLFAQAGLAGLGMGNVFDLVMAIVGVLTLGVGVAITKATSLAVGSGIRTGTKALAGRRDFLLQQRENAIKNALKERVTREDFKMYFDTVEDTFDRLRSIRNFGESFTENPNWWNLRRIPTTLKNDWALARNQWGKGFGDWAERVGGVDFQITRNRLHEFGSKEGLEPFVTAAPKWHTYTQGGLNVIGKDFTYSGLAINPVGVGHDQSRPWTDRWGQMKHPIPAAGQ